MSPSGFWGVGERDRFRRMGEQAGVLRLELLAVLRGQTEEGWRGEEEGRGNKLPKAKDRSQGASSRNPWRKGPS